MEHGCKIYFDPVSTASREEFARKVARDVCADPKRAECIDTVSCTYVVSQKQGAVTEFVLLPKALCSLNGLLIHAMKQLGVSWKI